MTAVTWRESAQHGTWLAELNGVLLAVTPLGVDRWQPTAGNAHGPVQETRLEAQREAEKLASTSANGHRTARQGC